MPRKLACCASSPESARAVACSCARRAKSGCVLEASANTPHGLAPKERGLSPVHCLSSGADRPEPARYGARASQARVVRLLPRESERSGALACAPRKSRLCVGGRSWQVAPSSCTEGDRPVAGAVPFHRIHADYNQRGTARVSRKLLCCASSPEIASAVARSCVRRAKAGCVFEASAGTSQHGLVPKERGLSPVQCFFQRVRTDANQRGTARASQARVLRFS